MSELSVCGGYSVTVCHCSYPGLHNERAQNVGAGGGGGGLSVGDSCIMLR